MDDSRFRSPADSRNKNYGYWRNYALPVANMGHIRTKMTSPFDFPKPSLTIGSMLKS